MDKRRFGALVAVAAVSVVAALLSAGVSGTASAGGTATSQDKPPINCGSDRWDVKTLSPNDEFVGKIAKKVDKTTINEIQQRARPPWDPGKGSTWSRNQPRQWDFLGKDEKAKQLPVVEATKWRVTKVKLVEAKLEADLDLHLIVEDPTAPNARMTVEFPDPDCEGAFQSKYKTQMARARQHLITFCGPFGTSSFTPLQGSATIVGVGFFDRPHGQKGDVMEVEDADPTVKHAKELTIELHPALSFSGLRKRSDCRP